MSEMKALSVEEIEALVEQLRERSDYEINHEEMDSPYAGLVRKAADCIEAMARQQQDVASADAEGTALLPCPFCGGEPYHVMGGLKHSHYVMCNGCNCSTAMRDSPEIAATEWNRRALHGVLEERRRAREAALRAGYKGGDLAEIITALAAVPVSAEKTSWIPVTERLPEEKKHRTSDVCLVTDGHDRAFRHYNFAASAWVGDYLFYQVTHWMPLLPLPSQDTRP